MLLSMTRNKIKNFVSLFFRWNKIIISTKSLTINWVVASVIFLRIFESNLKRYDLNCLNRSSLLIIIFWTDALATVLKNINEMVKRARRRKIHKGSRSKVGDRVHKRLDLCRFFFLSSHRAMGKSGIETDKKGWNKKGKRRSSMNKFLASQLNESADYAIYAQSAFTRDCLKLKGETRSLSAII